MLSSSLRQVRPADDAVAVFGLGDRELIARYDALHQACPDAFVQQSTAWAKVIGDIGPDEAFFLLCSDGERDVAALPLYLYRHPLGSILNSVPQQGGLGGIFCRSDLRGAAKQAAYDALLTAAVKLAEEQRCLTLSIITNPFDPDVALYDRALAPDLWFENFLQFVPLAGARPVMSHGHRQNLNRAARSGLEVRDCRDSAELAAWYAIHTKRHGEIGAAPYDRRLFEHLFFDLVPRGHARLLLACDGDRIVAGTFFIRHQRVLSTLMISQDSDHAAKRPNFAILDAAMRWAAADGVHVFNWESSAGKDGVFEFKRQWGSEERIYYYVTRVFCGRERLLEIGLDRIKQHYGGHYVVPFGLFKHGADVTRFKKG